MKKSRSAFTFAVDERKMVALDAETGTGQLESHEANREAMGMKLSKQLGFKLVGRGAVSAALFWSPTIWAQTEVPEAAAEAVAPSAEPGTAPSVAPGEEESTTDDSEAPEPSEPAEPSEPSEPEIANEKASAMAGDSAEREAESAARIAALEDTVARLEARQDATEEAALLNEGELEFEEDLLKIYGFMDMGIQNTWVDEDSIVGALFNTNAVTFAVGNINLYFDANPHPDWRGLAEIRFTGAPHGRVNNYGGIAGEFERNSTQQNDPHGTALNQPMWGGSIVIERAWIEWKRFQQFKVRTGSFFTPFGIWNVDHGSPTLISTAMPQFIQQSFFPIRQVGVQALGSFFSGPWEIAYRTWLSNGRQELANLDFTDDKAFGGRLLMRKETGFVRTQAGASFHHGRVGNKEIDIITAPPITDTVTFETHEHWAYVENIVGVDLSLDIGDTKIRTEATAQLRQYEDGKAPALGVEAPVPGAVEASSWRYATYLIVAQQLPWWGLEPYLHGELIQQQWVLADGFAMFAPGINVHFNPAAQLKLQVKRTWFFDWTRESLGEASMNDSTTVMARIVLAF